MLRLGPSTIARATRFSSRRFATTATDSSYEAERQAIKAHAAETSDLWRRISFYVCIPATLVITAWVRNVENEHEAHVEHIKAENGGHLPETPEYEYMNRRVKPFPWGYNSLFFNPHTNKDVAATVEE